MKLTADEIALAHEVKFDEEVCLLVKSQAKKKLERLQENYDYGSLRPGPGISVAVKDGEEAEQLMNALRDPLSKCGYRAFWSVLRTSNGFERNNEVAILKTDDPYVMIKIRQSDGANIDVSTDDIIHRLDEWKKLCDFDVVGASNDWVALQFSRLPKDLLRFSEEVYLLCPDAVGQGVGFKYRNDDRRIAEARRLFPQPLSERIRKKIAEDSTDFGDVADLPPGLADMLGGLGDFGDALLNEVDTGIRLLAYEIHQTKYLMLWWD